MSALTAASLRSYIQDTAAVNLPIGVQQLTDPELEACISRAVEEFNETPPLMFIQYTKDDFPYPHLLMLSASVEALQLTALKELRGEMNYTDGGISSTIYYKSPQYLQLREMLTRERQEKTIRVKKQLNLKNGFGGFS